MTAHPAIQRLSHIGLCVSNLERSTGFYRDVFGYKVVSTIKIGPEADLLLDLKNTRLDAVYMQRPGEDTRIELLYYHSPGVEISKNIRAVNLTGLTHLSFRTSDLKATVEEVKKFGGKLIETSLVDNSSYGIMACMVTDPDGLRIELLQAPGDYNLLPGQTSIKK
jgi:glyoxylase I family protein